MTNANIARALLVALAVGAMPGSATAGPKAPADIFRVSADGWQPDDAMKQATVTIERTCAHGNYVIVKNWINREAPGLPYHVVIAARCIV